MPKYDLKCERCGDVRRDVFCRMREVGDEKCRQKGCGGRCCVLHSPAALPKLARSWDEKEGVCRSMQFAPGSEGTLRKELGEDLKLDHTGCPVFTSDRQQRRVYKRMGQLKEQYELERVERAGLAADNGVTDDEVDQAARAIEGRFETSQAFMPGILGGD